MPSLNPPHTNLLFPEALLPTCGEHVGEMHMYGGGRDLTVSFKQQPSGGQRCGDFLLCGVNLHDGGEKKQPFSAALQE